MLITLLRGNAICQSVAEIWLNDEIPLGAVSHRFYIIIRYTAISSCEYGIESPGSISHGVSYF